MVVLSFYGMILLAGLFQSIKFVQGLNCYQCDHHGFLQVNGPCTSSSCDDDPFHKRIKQRFAQAIEDLKMTDSEKNQLRLEEYCYLKKRRPVPFDGETRGCFINLNFKNVSKKAEVEKCPLYEEWILCNYDDCNDAYLTKDYHTEMSLEDEGENSSSRSLPLENLSYLLALVLILGIN